MSKLKIVIGIVLVVVLAVVVVGVLSCGDDEPATPAGREQSGDRDEPKGDGDEQTGGATASSLRTVASKRGEGTNATAAASAILDKPGEIWLRVSAAPKQSVEGQWNITCDGATKMDLFVVTPPHLERLALPRKRPRNCVAGATAQLSGKGRLKVALLRDR